MSKENSQQLRQRIAQQAARVMAEDGVTDYAYAKRKAGRQLNVTDSSILPSNLEVEVELKLYNKLFLSEIQPEHLRKLRQTALATMQFLKQFHPYLTGSVLDGTAGMGTETQIHLFVDSIKDVEMFLLNQNIPFATNEKSYRVVHDGKRDKKGDMRKKVPVFSLETESGIINLSVFTFDDLRTPIKRTADGANAEKLDINGLTALLTS